MQELSEGWHYYRKYTTVKARQMQDAFTVFNPNGKHKGEAGDYICEDVTGDRFRESRDIFETLYEQVTEPRHRYPLDHIAQLLQLLPDISRLRNIVETRLSIVGQDISVEWIYQNKSVSLMLADDEKYSYIYHRVLDQDGQEIERGLEYDLTPASVQYWLNWLTKV